MLDAISKWFSALLDLICIEKGYTSLFKGAVFLAIPLLSVGQFVVTTSLAYEKEAFFLMHQIEADEKPKIEYDSPDKLTCLVNQAKEVYKNCKNSKYLFGLSSSLLSAYNSASGLLFLLMYVMFSVSVVGFVFRKPDNPSSV